MSLNEGSGTLNVVLGTKNAIIVASDSRRTWSDGSMDDSFKKLFPIGNRRVLTIAGLVEMKSDDYPWLRNYLPGIIDKRITCNVDWINLEEMQWDGEENPLFWPSLNSSAWRVVQGTMQTYFNFICAISGAQADSTKVISALLAGYKKDGSIKIEREILKPVSIVNENNLLSISFRKSFSYMKESNGFIYALNGKTEIANRILMGLTSAGFVPDIKNYDYIKLYYEKLIKGERNNLSEDELINLAKELIILTSENDKAVGKDPIQLVVLYPDFTKKEVNVFKSENYNWQLPVDGSWYSATVLDETFPFENLPKNNLVVSFCEISNNKFPINIDNNFYFANRLKNSTFKFDGGQIRFERNSDEGGNKLLLKRGVNFESFSELKSVNWNIEYYS